MTEIEKCERDLINAINDFRASKSASERRNVTNPNLPALQATLDRARKALVKAYVAAL